MTLYIDTKPTLEWVETYHNYTGSTYYCSYPYEIWKDETIDKFTLYYNNDLISGIKPLDTLDQAQAAAQADYERRTAQRFRPVELPEPRPAPPYESQYQLGQVSGHNRCLDRLNEIIQTALDRAKEK